jgi:putative oxidoreductase
VKIPLLIGRLILAAIFLYAAWVKLKEPWWMFAASIDSYQMVAPSISIFIARTLPWFELLLGLLLVIGFRLRWVAIASSALLLFFWLSMLRAWLKGMEIDCGCFGPGEAVSPKTLLRDGGMMALALFVAWGTFRGHAAKAAFLRNAAD